MNRDIEQSYHKEENEMEEMTTELHNDTQEENFGLTCND